MLHHLRAVFDVAAAETLMIGDTRTICRWRPCGVPVVAAAYGAHPRERRTRWRRSLLRDPVELWDWLRRTPERPRPAGRGLYFASRRRVQPPCGRQFPRSRPSLISRDGSPPPPT